MTGQLNNQVIGKDIIMNFILIQLLRMIYLIIVVQLILVIQLSHDEGINVVNLINLDRLEVQLAIKCLTCAVFVLLFATAGLINC